MKNTMFWGCADNNIGIIFTLQLKQLFETLETKGKADREN